MHVKIVLTTDEGRTFEGEADLAPIRSQDGEEGAASTAASPAAPPDQRLDFGLPIRAFLNKHATGGGGQKFAVLLARMTAGKPGVEVTREAVEREWARNKGVLGGAYHPVYATRSTGQGWTDSPRR